MMCSLAWALGMVCIPFLVFLLFLWVVLCQFECKYYDMPISACTHIITCIIMCYYICNMCILVSGTYNIRITSQQSSLVHANAKHAWESCIGGTYIYGHCYFSCMFQYISTISSYIQRKLNLCNFWAFCNNYDCIIYT